MKLSSYEVHGARGGRRAITWDDGHAGARQGARVAVPAEGQRACKGWFSGGFSIAKLAFLVILQNFAKLCKFLVGSFLAVSKRNFAIKYAFDSIFQALQDLHTFAPLQS